MSKPLIIHIITGLNNGGTEATLFQLCNLSQHYKHIVISLTNEGKYGPLFLKNKIEVECLNINSLTSLFKGTYKLYSILKYKKSLTYLT